MLFAFFSSHCCKKVCVIVSVPVCDYFGLWPFIRGVSVYDSPKSLNPKWWSCQKINQPPAFFIDRVIGLPMPQLFNHASHEAGQCSGDTGRGQIWEVWWLSCAWEASCLCQKESLGPLQFKRSSRFHQMGIRRHMWSGLIPEVRWLSWDFTTSYLIYHKRKY